jgi:hypothetical protein
MPIRLTFHQPQLSLSSSPLSPSLPPPLPPLSLLSTLLLLPPPQFPLLSKLIIVCACNCPCCHSHCHHCCHCHCSRGRCCCHHSYHRRCRRYSRCRLLHRCLTTTSQSPIPATIECSFHPQLLLLLLSISTVNCQRTQSSIATVVSLFAGHFLHQSLNAALRQYHC